jgi:hypothetical protein
MAGNFQDDTRENAMRELFRLYKDESEGRSGIDAYLDLDGHVLPFELKTTSKGSVTTVRDFGLDHIEKWRGKHWLIGFFIGNREYYKYGSPDMMAQWIQDKGNYIASDLKLASLSSDNLKLDDMYSVLGKKVSYSYEDARSIQKMQYKKDEYISLQDVNDGYSPSRMLEIMKDRVTYLIQRGSTLNNPHIPLKYFIEWPEITEDHAEQLRKFVRIHQK